MKDIPRHQCLIYEGAPSVHLASIAGTLAERLNANYRCLYLNSPAMVAGMRSHLSAAGIHLTACVERGALILSSDQGHLVDGRFDVDRMLMMLRDQVQRAVSDGYRGLWASGDMAWEFGSENNLEKLLEYERKLDALIRDNPALCGVCQYHRDRLPPHALATALTTHPALYLRETAWQANPAFARLA